MMMKPDLKGFGFIFFVNFLPFYIFVRIRRVGGMA